MVKVIIEFMDLSMMEWHKLRIDLSYENAIFWNIIDCSFQSKNTLYIIYYYKQQFLLPMCQINGKFNLTEKLLT